MSGLAIRIIPCLDVNAGRVVKGMRFSDLRDAGDPVAVARRYSDEGADEITFLDITASSDKRETVLHMVEAVANQVFIPLSVGGGIRSLDDIRRLLMAGADKVTINTAAVDDPKLIARAVDQFGAQCIVVAIDAKQDEVAHTPRWQVYTHGGRTATGLDVLQWVETITKAGAGEILLTSMDQDGMRQGFDLELTRRVSEASPIPLIASGGVGTLQHLLDGITLGKADAVLAASIFHYKQHTIQEAKLFLKEQGVSIRI